MPGQPLVPFPCPLEVLSQPEGGECEHEVEALGQPQDGVVEMAEAVVAERRARRLEVERDLANVLKRKATLHAVIIFVPTLLSHLIS